jgi:signal peptidase II
MVLYFAIAVVVCVLDQLFKLWIKSNIPVGGHMDFLPNIMDLTHVHNSGAAFSFLSEHTWILSVISIAAIVVIAVLILNKGTTKWEKIALALVLGGAVGNAIDRIFSGYVVDMFETLFVNFAIFNVADIFIDVGTILFAILYLVRTCKQEKKAKSGTETDAEETTGDNTDNS